MQNGDGHIPLKRTTPPIPPLTRDLGVPSLRGLFPCDFGHVKGTRRLRECLTHPIMIACCHAIYVV